MYFRVLESVCVYVYVCMYLCVCVCVCVCVCLLVKKGQVSSLDLQA